MRTSRIALLSLLAVTTGAGGAPDTYPRQPGVDVVHYAFHLTLSDDTNAIVGTAQVSVLLEREGIGTVWLDLADASPDRDGQGMTVSSARVDGLAASYTHSADRLTIRLPSPSRAGQRIRITVEYGGVPATGLRIGPTKHGDRSFFSDNWPTRARHWLPTIDHPGDKATSEFRVTAPAHYQVVSNGLLVEETDLLDGTRVTHWKQSVPIPPWLFVLGVARFAVQHVDDYQGRAIQTWVYAQDRDAGFYDFAVPTRQVLEFYGSYVGPFAYEKLANIQAASVGGGMEAASAIFYGENSVTGDRTERWRNVIIHEIAHQWFGNAVTEADWDDVWLSEGFATYFTLLFIEHAYGRDEFVAGLKSARNRVWGWYDEHPDYRIVHEELADMSQVTSIATYQKGAWVLHQLRRLVGDEAFWRGVRDYYRTHYNGNATTGDFRRAVEEASGLELEWFFRQWLYQGGNPSVQGSWHWADGTLTVDLRQVQEAGRFFRLPLDIGIETQDGTTRIETVEMVRPDGRFTFAVTERPREVILDPGTWALIRSDFGERR